MIHKVKLETIQKHTGKTINIEFIVVGADTDLDAIQKAVEAYDLGGMEITYSNAQIIHENVICIGVE